MEVSACMPQFMKTYDSIVIFAGQRVVTKTHSHHALEIILSFDIKAIVHTEDGIVESKGLLLRQNFPHATSCEGFIIFICISPESILGKRLVHILGNSNIVLINEKALEKIRNYICDLITHEYNENEIIFYLTAVLIPSITHVEKNYTPDFRVANVIHYINENICKPFQFKTLTEIACLSESRLMHLFKKEIGIPIRKYVLWCRLQSAIRFFLKGHTLTQSAHQAGFSDVAHFTRTFVSAFGMSPSQLLKNFNG